MKDKINISNTHLKNLCKSVLINENQNVGDVTFIITNDETLRKLKKEFFNMDVYTDVITFNLAEDNALDGEIYISWDRVQENSNNLDLDVDEELKRMVIHGSLHLVGHEDKSSKDKMFMTNLEEKYLKSYPQAVIK